MLFAVHRYDIIIASIQNFGCPYVESHCSLTFSVTSNTVIAACVEKTTHLATAVTLLASLMAVSCCRLLLLSAEESAERERERERE